MARRQSKARSVCRFRIEDGFASSAAKRERIRLPALSRRHLAQFVSAIDTVHVD
jgi:hypothetical protein